MKENLQNILKQSGSEIIKHFGSNEFVLKDDASQVSRVKSQVEK